VNSQWSRPARAAILAALAASVLGCHSEKRKQAAAQAAEHTPQGNAQLLGRELAQIVDRVMAYRSSHRGQLPVSLRQAGIDSLTPTFSRQFAHQGGDPLITIRFRDLAGRQVAGCWGTNMVLEDAMLHGGRFDVTCELTDGSTKGFTIEPPPPPEKKDD
jgi:hypothetical protein